MSQPSFESLGVRAPSSRPTDLHGLKRDLQAGHKVLCRRVQPCLHIRAMPDLGERVLRFVLATEGVKRDGHSVACSPEAWVLDNFIKNPAVLHAHDYGSPDRPPGLQVGSCVNLSFERDDGRWVMVGDARFASHQMAQDTYILYLPVEQGGDGCGRAVSIGWDPLEYVPMENGGLHFPLNELLEFSTVPIGADPDAVMKMRARGVPSDRIDQIMNATRYMENAHGRAYVLDWRDPIEGRSRPTRAQPARAQTEKTEDQVKYLLSDASPLTEEEKEKLKKEIEDGTVKIVAKTDGQKAEATKPLASRDEPLRWNRQLSRAWDVTKDQFYQGTPDLGLAARYFDCEIREIAEWADYVPSARMGAFFVALEETLAEWRIDGVRRVEWDYGKECPVEYPPEFESIRLNSKHSGEFLVSGTRFMRRADDPSVRALMKIERSYRGASVTLFCVREQREVLSGWYVRTQRRAAELKLLRGEAFSLGGEFLERGDTTWDDLFLKREHLDVLRRQVQLLNEKGAALPSRGIILAGPPGTGKTLAGRVMMREASSATFIWISARDLYYAGAFGGFEHAFDLARENTPTILFVEDVDNFFRESTIDLLKSQMDGLAQRNAGIMTVLTTNFPERLPRALIDRPGRFHDVLEIGLPADAERGQMLGRWLPELIDAELRARVVAATDGYSGAHMREFATFVRTLRDEDGTLSLPEAVERALSKIAEQREFIDRVQIGEGFRPARALEEEVKRMRQIRGLSRIGKKMASARLAFLKEQIEDLEDAKASIDEVISAIRGMIDELDDKPPVDDEPEGEGEIARLASELEAAVRKPEEIRAEEQPTSPDHRALDDLITSLNGRLKANTIGDLARDLLSGVGEATKPVQ